MSRTGPGPRNPRSQYTYCLRCRLVLARLPHHLWTAGVLRGGTRCSGDVLMPHKPAAYDGRGFAYLFGTGRRVNTEGDDHEMKTRTVEHTALKPREGMTADEVAEFLADLRRQDNWPAARISARTRGWKARLTRLTAVISYADAPAGPSIREQEAADQLVSEPGA